MGFDSMIAAFSDLLVDSFSNKIELTVGHARPLNIPAILRVNISEMTMYSNNTIS